MDDNGKEYWSSRDLCNAMGYSGYWKFQNVIDKAIKVASEKGMDIDDHFNQRPDILEAVGARGCENGAGGSMQVCGQ